ncbi:uncharacterized protein AKAW2_70495A [Aspergillus luchuensis]|uniref:Uncharacterized protein n=1 Tax=Aspergillus kawachii TaxID=1069201 RepID=A0A7R7WII2_ASPKA|nr:uncharacterized protein AKAW2_70495A [Aspergillus luchuensis]BCS03617.1 hypothetical protein AKAW2_70495A [Aspergillus luchuensis]
MEEGVVDGLIRSMGESGRNDAPKHFTIQEQTISFGKLFDEEHADWILPSFAPQRSILDHLHIHTISPTEVGLTPTKASVKANRYAILLRPHRQCGKFGRQWNIRGAPHVPFHD